MRVWMLENTPDYEQATLIGIYLTPLVAWDDVLKQFKEHAMTRDEFTVSVGTRDWGIPAKEQTSPELEIGYNSGDIITLQGVAVQGTNNHPSPDEWMHLRRVANDLVKHAEKEAGFVRIEDFYDADAHKIRFRLRKEETW